MRSRVLLETPAVCFGDFECPPGDALWDEVNANIGACAHVVFPRTCTVISQRAARPVLCTPNHVVFYRANQLYRRAVHDVRGDVCVWIAVGPALLDEVGGLPEPPTGRGDPHAYLLAIALARRLAAPPGLDRLVGEEAVMQLLGRALTPPPVAGARRGRRARTRRAQAELVEEAKLVLVAQMAAPPSLTALAGALHVSPFHLARVFAAHTGFSPGAYVHGLRLRAAVERLLDDPRADLSRLALELGYCSASHFTDRFRVAFGRPPSRVRGAELRTIVEAASPAAA